MSTDQKTLLAENPDMEKKYPSIPTDYPIEGVGDPMPPLVWKPVMLTKTNYNGWKCYDPLFFSHFVYLHLLILRQEATPPLHFLWTFLYSLFLTCLGTATGASFFLFL